MPRTRSVRGYRGDRSARTADVTTFSFFPTKNLTTAEGGAVATADAGIADAARRFRNHGLVRDRPVSEHRTRAAGTRRCTRSASTTGCRTCCARSASCSCAARLRSCARRARTGRPLQRLAVRRRRACDCRRSVPDVEPGLAPLRRCACSTAGAARCTTGCAPPASACRSTTSRRTGIRSSRTSGTGAACARTRRRSTAAELSLPLFPDLTDTQQDQVVDALRDALP